MRIFTLFLLMFGFWCLLSGATINPWDEKHPVNVQLLIAGLISCTLVLVLCLRMKIIDDEGQPLQILPMLGYLPWLSWQVIRANVDVARVVSGFAVGELPLDGAAGLPCER